MCIVSTYALLPLRGTTARFFCASEEGTDVEGNHNKYVCKTTCSLKLHGSDTPVRCNISYSKDGLLENFMIPREAACSHTGWNKRRVTTRTTRSCVLCQALLSWEDTAWHKTSTLSLPPVRPFLLWRSTEKYNI